MPGRMRENRHHDRETGKYQKEAARQGHGDDQSQSAMVNGFISTALMEV